MKKLLLLSAFLITTFSFNSYGQGSYGPCLEGGGGYLDEAALIIALGEELILSINDCQSNDDYKYCNQLYKDLQDADQHLTYILQDNDQNGCMLCDLTQAYNLSLRLDDVAKDLYTLNYPGQNYITGRISSRIKYNLDRICPDLNGTWYRSDYPDIRIDIQYVPTDDLFYADINDRGSISTEYLKVAGPDLVKIYDSEIYGRLYNNNNNLNWGNLEWIREGGNVSGKWSMDGKDIFYINKIGKGKYQLICDYVVTVASLYKKGDVFAEIWTNDHTYFNGEIIVPGVGKTPIYLYLENNVFYVNTSNDVFNDTSKAYSRISKL